MKTLVLFACLSLLASCGDDDSAPAPESPDVEACEHLQEGPAQPLVAGASADDSAPLVGADHKRYDLTLVDGAESFVRFAAAEATDHVFFTGSAVDIAFLDAGGAEIVPEDVATSSPECTDVAGKYTVALAVGTYHLRFAPGAAGPVSLVVEEAEHDHAGE